MSNPQEAAVSTGLGMISSLLLGSIMSMVGDVAMAFVFGLVGALGGWVAKILIEKFNKWRSRS